MIDRVLNMCSLAKKAGKAASGGFLSEEAVRKGAARLVILAMDASNNSQKSLRDICAYYKVPIVSYGTKESLGHAIGCEQRASITITDDGIANKILNLLNTNGGIMDGKN